MLIAPSNPFLSIDPVLAIPEIRAALIQTKAPVVAVSPIIGGKAVKGPTAKIMSELGLTVDNATIARHYAEILDGMIIDSGDTCDLAGLEIARTATLMRTLDDKTRVAKAALEFAETLS